MLTYQLFGVKFNATTMAQSLEILEKYLETDIPHLVVTIGPEMVMRAQENEEFRTLVNGADLVVPDGAGMLWAAKQSGYQIQERVAGVDLIVNFAEILAKKGEKLFLLGAAPGVAEKAAENLKKRFPGLEIAGALDGYFKDPLPVVKAIAESKASVLYVGIGSPNQEKFVRTYGKEMGIKVGIGVGGSFDVLSGLKKRAPNWMIKLHLEWLYRFMCEPSRVGRMMAIPKFMRKVSSAGKKAVTIIVAE